MQREILKFLYDVKVSIDSIQEYLGQNTTLEIYKTNKLLRRAVERELEIIGEAVNRILKIDQSIEISDSRRIVNLRNLVIHQYDGVDDLIIWGIISSDLPKLKIQVESLLSAEVTNS